MEIHTHSEFPLILIHLVPPLQNPSCCAPLLHNYPANSFDLFRCIYFLCDACAANLFQMYILCIFVQLSPDYLIILYIQRAVSLVRPPCCISVPRFNVKTNSDKFVHRQGNFLGLLREFSSDWQANWTGSCFLHPVFSLRIISSLTECSLRRARTNRQSRS